MLVVGSKLKNEDQEYTTIKKIGKGGQAVVWEVIDLIEHKFALKAVDKENLRSPSEISKIRQEIRNHRVLNHQNIVKFFSYFQDTDYMYIVLELCKHDLNEMIKSHYKEVKDLYQKHIDSGNDKEYIVLSIIPYDSLKAYAKGILEGLVYMHSKNIAHLDIKPQNILMCNDIPKISDFGFSRDVSKPITSMAGTPNYVAPEILNGEYYTTEPDIWSYGVMIYTCVIGIAPFENRFDREKMNKNIVNIKYTFPFETSFIQPPEEIKNIIRLCLQAQADRITGANLLKQMIDF